ncbi:TPA: hypothetical protein QCS75_004334 [Bacillus anthracis]|nr:hypothetical protein [Bacillus anthracis]
MGKVEVKKKKKLSVMKFLIYMLIAIVVINWIYKTPEEKKADLEEKVASYEEFESHCITYEDWNVDKGGNKNLNTLYNDPQECLEKELFIWRNDGTELTRGVAKLVFHNTDYYFTEEELKDDIQTEAENKYKLLEEIQRECKSTLLGGFSYDYYTDGYDYIIEDTSDEKSKMNEKIFNSLFEITKTYKNN